MKKKLNITVYDKPSLTRRLAYSKWTYIVTGTGAAILVALGVM